MTLRLTGHKFLLSGVHGDLEQAVKTGRSLPLTVVSSPVYSRVPQLLSSLLDLDRN